MAGIASPHSCEYCNKFVLHLYDALGELRASKPTWHRPNPSHDRLAVSLFGEAWWAEEWHDYRGYLYTTMDGITFFDATHRDLAHSSRQGCLLARRFLECLDARELPERYVTGIQIITAYSAELGIFDLDEMKWETLLGPEDEEKPDNVYTILAEKDNPAARILDHHSLNPNPGSVANMENSRSWLSECMGDHYTCKKPDPNYTPTRLIEIIRKGDSTACRLCEMSSVSTKPYAALSYCWGGSQTFKTTTRSLSGYTEKINIDNLPQTLQDAIFVTWNLDLRYIWIDALCIIQDSDSDKAFEIGQMARVYSNATITIAATRAKAVWGGFLGERTMLGLECPNRVFSLPCQLGGEDLGNIILLPSIHEGLDPLDTRGWTFQERILSPRIIDFGTFRTQYTCQNSLGEAPCDGWSSQPIEQAYGAGLNSRVMSDLISGSYPTQDMLSYWLGIVSGFTNRVLSFPSDRLPAIAGMAECFGLILKDDYLAGHWRAGLLPSLLWSNPRLMDLLPRATGGNVDVPSWSWASASGHIIFHSFSTNPDDTTYFAAGVIECTTEPTDMRVPYGGVKQGELLLQASSRPAKWLRKHIYGSQDVLFDIDGGLLRNIMSYEVNSDYQRAAPHQTSKKIHFIPDSLEVEFQDDPYCALDVHLLLFGTIEPHTAALWPSFFGLVVRKAPMKAQYRRVGMFHKSVSRRDFDAYMAWFLQEEAKQFWVI